MQSARGARHRLIVQPHHERDHLLRRMKFVGERLGVRFKLRKWPTRTR